MPPTAFSGGSGSVHIELQDAGLKEYSIVIELSGQAVVSAIHIETPKTRPLREFTFGYVKQGIQYPNTWNTLDLADDKPLVYVNLDDSEL